jgi:hypothetical protein
MRSWKKDPRERETEMKNRS